MSATGLYRRYSTRARVREFSNQIEMDGYKTVEPGTVCEVDVETAEQDGYRLRAVTVRPEL
jgi:hypothetical protein